MPDGFVLAPYRLETDATADGLADDLRATVVYVHAGRAATPAPGALLRAEGVLEWGALEEADGRVSWLRLRADTPPAAAVP